MHVKVDDERHTDEYPGPTKPGLCADAPSFTGSEARAMTG